MDNNRRRHSRFAVAIAAELEVDGETLEAETRDVSEGGASLLLERALEEDSTTRVTLILTEDGIEDPNEEPFEADAAVMWAAQTDDGRTLHGLRFGGLPGDQLARLRRFLALLAESAARAG